VDPQDLRQHPRFRVALRVHLALASERGRAVTTTTVGVSRTGMSVKLAVPPDIGEDTAVTIELPSGTTIDGVARTKNHLPGSLVGMSLVFTGDAQAYWDAFVDEEESTGSLWRMIGRVARAPDDANAPRGLSERVASDDLRFHTVGENGEAYRIAFQKHESDPGVDSDLAQLLPGFKEQAKRLVTRVLREPVTLRLDEGSSRLSRVRVAELVRGGYAWVQGLPSTTQSGEELPVGLVALGVGELIVVMKNGQSVFPHYSDMELEQIACDTFRRELDRPVFGTTPARGTPRPKMPAPVPLPPLASAEEKARFREGYDAVRFAQTANNDVQMRRYGNRDIWFHPSVWAKVSLDDGSELMGPTLQDDGRVCILALVGMGAPRVVKLDAKSRVKLLKPPSK
jgi:hypothetical protein